MNVEAVDLAVRAGGKEVLQVRETHGVTASVGDSGSTELGLTLERVHVLCVSGGGSCVAQVGLCREIWLVEGEEVSRAGADSSLGVLVPGVHKVGACAPQGWDESVIAAQTVAGRSPVLGPRDFTRAFKAGGKASIVVSETTLSG